MLRNIDQEVDYRVIKWMLRNMEKQGLLLPEEIKAIWTELIETYDPPTRSLEEVTETILGDGNG